MHGTLVEWLNLFWTAGAGAVGGVIAAIKWFNKRFADYQRQLDIMQHDLATARQEIAVLKNDELHKTARLDQIERSLERLDTKQDQQTELLLKIASKGAM